METAVNVSDNFLDEAETSEWNETALPSVCRRCGGLMVLARYMDCWDDADNVAVRRCVQCGEVVDPVILHNRRTHGAGGFDRGKS
jgi:hypothetical protein